MVMLTQEKCVACRADSPHVTEPDAGALRAQTPEWELITEDGIPKLSRVFRFRSFVQALAFTNAVGALAEEQGHHPRLVTEWGRVTVAWWTHKIRNLHRNDFIMAARTGQLYAGLAEAQPAAATQARPAKS
ncbi:MAG: 4a-hydroxytetrahydrobiopterin dehydratase [Dehalococcoidia bacterium]|nr:4a-hydroxytetrahydrobiopterin dehydratase [Dehalococcoidia bacterium]MSQ17480.1 4a-hydroxytetrahydrobiopterin dehydratase [Dehalococcoidia bacterium]